jgi:FMN phosphatase YigB (HAD superfamily)
MNAWGPAIDTVSTLPPKTSGDIQDRRLIPLRDGLADGRYRVLSVDIFDTLVWRRVPEPEDLFFLLGRALAADGKLASHVSPIQFAELRRAAQRAAREKAEAATGYREIRLTDVYAGLPDSLFAAGFDANARIAAELACEKSHLLLDEDLAGLVRFAKVSGAKVFFVSDTYFTAAEIWELLAAAGFTDKALVDRLYVSCEAGRPKYRDLFDTVLKDAGVPAAAYAHVGDNIDADIHPGRHRGMATVHYDKWIFAPRVQTEEFTADLAQRAQLLSGRGDFGLTGARGRLFHRAPETLDAAHRFYWSYGAAILAPVFAGFARWVLSQSAGVPVYGVMREGRFLGRVLAATAADLGLSVDVRELWLSRRAVLRAAVYEDGMRFLPDAISLSPGHTPEECVASLGLTIADIKAVMPDFDFGRADSLTRLANAIASTLVLRDKVVIRSAQLRRNLLAALKAKIDFKKPFIVMDLGYAATIQSVLGRILRREGITVPITGLYLAANEKALHNTREGADIRAYLNRDGYGGLTGALLSRTPDVLEHACMCSEGSLADYDEAGQPVLLASQRSAAQIAQMEALQAGILAGVSVINKLLGSFTDTPADQPELKTQIERIIQAALLHPTTQEAETIGAWHHEANFDLSDLRRLKDLSFDARALQYQGWPALQDIGRHQVYWPAAAFASAAPFFGEVFAAGAKARYDVDHLTSGPALGALTITPDLGVGFDARREGAVSLTVNAFGRGEIVVTIKGANAEAFQRLRLKLPAVRAVFGLDHFSAAFSGERDHRTVDLLGENARRITWNNADAGPDSAYTTTKQGSTFDVDLSRDVPPWLHTLTLRLRFKYLRLDDVFG